MGNVTEADGNAIFKGGIIAARTISVANAEDVVANLSQVEWRPSTVSYRDHAFRVTELVDKGQRDALSAGFDRAAQIGQELVHIVGPVARALIKKFWEIELTHASSPQFIL
jgi:hypothetical protein